MKKYLGLAVICIFATTLFAQTAHVDGSVISQFGGDLDSGTSGFNAGLSDVNIKINQSVEPGNSVVTGSGDSEFYGEVSVTGISIEASTEIVNSGDGLNDWETYSTNAQDWDWTPGLEIPLRLIWGNIASSLHFGPNFNVTLFANSGKTQVKKSGVDTWGDINQNAYEYTIFSGKYGDTDLSTAEGLSWDNDTKKYFMGVNNDYSTVSWITGADTYYEAFEGVQGTYTADDIGSFTFAASSNGDWTSNVDNEYAIKGSANINAIDNLTCIIEASRAIGRVNKDDGSAIYRTDLDTEFGVKLGYALDLGDSITLSPVVGADIGMLDNYKSDASLDANSNLKGVMWSGTAGLKAALSGSILTAYYSMNGREDNPDSAYTIAFNQGTVENLILQAAYEYSHLYLADETSWTGNRYVNNTGATAKLGYALAMNDKATVTPSAQVSLYKTDYEKYGSVAAVTDDMHYNAKAGVEVNGLLENTVFSLDWSSNDLSLDEDTFGELVFTTEVSF